MTRPDSAFLKRGGAFVALQFVFLGLVGVRGARRRLGSRVGLLLMGAGVAPSARRVAGRWGGT